MLRLSLLRFQFKDSKCCMAEITSHSALLEIIGRIEPTIRLGYYSRINNQLRNNIFKINIHIKIK